ncbi:unnamed protein product [Aphis gossypii]|uniref:Uncharacterized protein n=1 Tax=Aphis gossypii TaxID=80765 RepID=A0A9P0JE43_APHGO|nr:unnamed protein product [Aphis gossypii]
MIIIPHYFEIVRIDVVRFKTVARAYHLCLARTYYITVVVVVVVITVVHYIILFFSLLLYYTTTKMIIIMLLLLLLLLLYRFSVGPTAVPSGCSANCALRNFRCSEARKQYAQVNSARGVRRRGAVIIIIVIVIIIIRHGGDGGVRGASSTYARR